MSTITRLTSSPDQVVGVADLRLCGGDKWRESVKVCFELFSTAAASDRVAAEMQRNSVQGNSCSFGFVEFNLTKTQVKLECSFFIIILNNLPLQMIVEKRTKIAETCYPKGTRSLYGLESVVNACCGHFLQEVQDSWQLQSILYKYNISVRK